MISLIDLNTLDAAGVQFSASYSTVWGGGEMSLEPAEVLQYLKDKENIIASHLGVEAEDYILWIESEGCIFCTANTNSGKRCRNMVDGTRIQHDIKEWKELREKGGYCKRHGG